MAVYMFTYHAYRSWMPDRPQGYVRKGKVLPTDEEEARRYGRRACNPQITFDRTMQQTLVSNARVVCDESHWRLHQVRAIPTHLHVLVSWEHFVDWKAVSSTLKRRLGSSLSKALDRKGPWSVGDPAASECATAGISTISWTSTCPSTAVRSGERMRHRSRVHRALARHRGYASAAMKSFDQHYRSL